MDDKEVLSKRVAELEVQRSVVMHRIHLVIAAIIGSVIGFVVDRLLL